MSASAFHRIPLAPWIAIINHESGKVGRATVNKHGKSRDYGPGQVNTYWLGKLAKQGITAQMLQNNGCVNAYASAWVFSQAWERAEGNVWRAVGLYNAGNGDPVRMQWYIGRVWRDMSKGVDVKQMLSRMNKYVSKSQIRAQQPKS